MGDRRPSRGEVAAYVFRRLAHDSRFRNHFAASAPDGSRHIVVALRSDPMQRVVDEVMTVGGSSNLVVPLLNGFFIAALTPGDDGNEEYAELDPDCTVGVFIMRLHHDGPPMTYSFRTEDEHSESGRAELVALAEG